MVPDGVTKIETLPRREREKLRQRQEMLNAALQLFTEKGYHSVSMHEIAGKAEFAIGTLYKFFRNKEDLYRALVLEQSERFHEALAAAIEEPEDEIEKLNSYIRIKGEFFRDNYAMIRIYFAESHGLSFNLLAGLDAELIKRYERFLNLLASVFDSGVRRKRFRSIADPYHLAVALDSMVNAFLFLWLNKPERHPRPEVPGAILDIFSKALISS
jgi:AcrR family transcriptional regulator